MYKLLYTLQIVEAVMEEGEGEGMEKISLVESEAQKKIPPAPPLVGPVAPPGLPQDDSSIPSEKEEAKPVEVPVTPEVQPPLKQ